MGGVHLQYTKSVTLICLINACHKLVIQLSNCTKQRSTRKMVKLSNLERARVIGLLEAGRSRRDVANQFHVSVATLSRLVRRYRETGDVKDRVRSGRPRITTAVEDRRIRLLSLRSRDKPATVIRDEIRVDRANPRQGLSVQTVRNQLHNNGLRSRKTAMKPLLNDGHKQARLTWARQHVRWTRQQWSHVLFTDESRFCLDHHDGRVRVWRRRGERFADSCVRSSRQGRGGSVMIWAGISEQGKTDLVFVEGNMNAQRYIDQVLQPVILPYAHNHGQNFMMNDNARPHRARIVDNFLQGHHITRMHPWPACSPDMNPIEHCWDQLGRAIARRRVPGDTLNDLRHYIREEMAEYSSCSCQGTCRQHATQMSRMYRQTR